MSSATLRSTVRPTVRWRLLLTGLASFFLLSVTLRAQADVPAPDEPSTVYTGTVGAAPIVMELPRKLAAGDAVEGRYFYTQYRADLSLSADIKNPNTLLLTEGDEDDAPHLTLKRQADGGWQGQWVHGKRQLPIHLQIAVLPPLPPQAGSYLRQARSKNLYVYLRLLGLTLQPLKQEAAKPANPTKSTQSTNSHAPLQWLQEPHTKLSVFQLSAANGYPAPSLPLLNLALQDWLWSEVELAYECLGVKNSYYQNDVQPTLFSAAAISAKVASEEYCGGAYPNHIISGINLNAQTGAALTLADVLAIPPKPHSARRTGANMQNTDAGTPDLSAWLLPQLKKLYPKQMTPSEDGCVYDDPGFWADVNWYLTPKGITFIPLDFPHAAQVCADEADWAVFPWATMQRNPGPWLRHWPLASAASH